MSVRGLLPEEIVMEILLILPSKSLTRFKSACKTWRSLFSSSSFMAKHLLPDRDDDNLLLVMYCQKATHNYTVSLLSDRTLAKQPCPLLLPQYPDHGQPQPQPYVEILGCCNHLVCIEYRTKNPLIALWSLATGDVKFLPPSHVPDRPGGTYFFKSELGFGYDATSQDYKVIRITPEYPDTELKKVEIYSFNNDSWSGMLCDDLPATILPSDHFRRVYTNGIFSWLAATHPHEDLWNWILWFRFSDESFGAFKLPPDRFDGESYGLNNKFLVLDDRVGIVIYDSTLELVERSFHVWVLLEFGVEDSWTRLFTLGPLIGMIEFPLWFWNNGKMIMVNSDGQLVLRDPFGQQIKLLEIDASADHLSNIQNIQIIPITAKYIHKTENITSGEE